MPFKIMLICHNANSIIKDLRPQNRHPGICLNLTKFSEEPGAVHKIAEVYGGGGMVGGGKSILMDFCLDLHDVTNVLIITMNITMFHNVSCADDNINEILFAGLSTETYPHVLCSLCMPQWQRSAPATTNTDLGELCHKCGNSLLCGRQFKDSIHKVCR